LILITITPVESGGAASKATAYCSTTGTANSNILSSCQ
jgi:hypothetical protein